MSSIKNQKIGGDASVGRNVAMGGNGRIAGSLIIGHNLQVKGWLEAPNIKDTNKGVFASVESLSAAYPSPRNGWFAGVGESTPFDLYVAEGGEWVATGGELDVEVDIDYYNGEIERIDGDIHDLTDDVSANSEAIEQHDGLIAGHTQQIAEITETLTDVQQTATAAKEQSESNADSIGEHTEQIGELSSTVSANSQSIAGHAQQIEQISGTLAEARGTADEAKYQSTANAVNISRVNALVGYYECSTPSSVSAKTITANSFSRIVGGCMHVKMHFANTASSVTLNINGTGAIALYYNGKHVSARNTWEDDEIVVVFFDGDEYQAFPVGAKYIEQQSQPQPSQPEDFPELDELEERVGSLERAAGQHNVLPFDSTLSFPSVTPSDTLYEHTIQPREAFEYSICLISVLGSVRFCLKVGNDYYNNWSIKKQFSSDGLIPVGQGSIDDPYSVPTGTYTEEISNNDWYSGELHNKVFYNRSNKVVYAYNCETKSLEAMTNIQVVEENAPEAESTSNPNNSTKGSIVVDLENDKMLTWDGNKWKEISGGKSAYELAFAKDSTIGTEEEWLASLNGTDGKSAYELWVEQPGNEGKTVSEFLASLKESGFGSKAVLLRPTTDIDTNTIYCIPNPNNTNEWTEEIYDTLRGWIVLGTHVGGLADIMTRLQETEQTLRQNVNIVDNTIPFEYGAVNAEGTVIDSNVRVRTQRLSVVEGENKFMCHIAPTLDFARYNYAYDGVTPVRDLTSSERIFENGILTVNCDGTFDNVIVVFTHGDTEITQEELEECYIYTYTPLKEQVEQNTSDINKIKEIKDDIDEIKDSFFTDNILQFEYGAVSNNGAVVSNTVRVRTQRLSVVEGENKFMCHIASNLVFARNNWCYLGTTPAKELTADNRSLINGVLTITCDGTFDNVIVVFTHGDTEITQEELEECYITKHEPINYISNKYKGLKYCALGDSITYGYIPRNYDGYPGQLNSYARLTAQKLGMNFVNYGISGSSLAYIASRNPMCVRYANMPDDADVITVMGGTNDIRNGIHLGQMSDRTYDTYYGALHVLFQGLYTKYIGGINPAIGKKKKIVALTPIKLLDGRKSSLPNTIENNADILEPNFELWAKAVKEVAEFYSVPCLDFYNLSGINPHLDRTLVGTEPGYTGNYNPYITDGTHPTQEGAEIMADVLTSFLLSI